MQLTGIIIQPLLPTTDLDRSVAFFQALGFEVVQQTTIPYPFAEVRCGEFWIHLSGLGAFGGKKAFSACMIMTGDLARWHEHFASGLRNAYGAVPVSGLPRITRLRPNQNGFAIFDPDGHMLVFLDPALPGPAYAEPESELARLRTQAEFLRDTYANDVAAARMLDRAIASADGSERVELGRILAQRAEIAIALNDGQDPEVYFQQIEDLRLSASELAAIASDLDIARNLERWIHHGPDPASG